MADKEDKKLITAETATKADKATTDGVTKEAVAKKATTAKTATETIATKSPATKSPVAKKPAVAKKTKSLGDWTYRATGKRKDSVARVWVTEGKGDIIVNGKNLETYFVRPVLRMIINQPFVAVNIAGKFDVFCTVRGGGLSGQAGAVRHGISRALGKNSEFRPVLRKGTFLTRDARTVERKKYGRRKARRSFQFSKR